MKRATSAFRLTDLKTLKRSAVQERMGLFWIEGTNCLEVALQANWPVIGVYGTDAWLMTNGLSLESKGCKEPDAHGSKLTTLVDLWQKSRTIAPQSERNNEITAALSLIQEAWHLEFPETSSLDALMGFHRIDAKELGKIADAKNPDGVVALCLTPELRKRTHQRPSSSRSNPEDSCHDDPVSSLPKTATLAIYQLQDPGNLGSLLRTSVATGVSEIVLSPGSVDPTHPKVLRATAGQWFKNPPRRCRSDDEFEAWLIQCRRSGVRVVATEVSSDGQLDGELEPSSERESVCDLWSLDLSKPTIFLLGNEARGLPPKLKDLATHFVHIPMENDVDSLNVGVAGAILLYEALRQRKQTIPSNAKLP
jgi:tRNA G18 (ribose-2'-O)-methylase SpoU